MLLALARVFLVEPFLGVVRFIRGEMTVCASLFRRVLKPDVSQRPTQESILTNGRDFFRFLSYWVILQVSVMELSGTDSDLVAESMKYGVLLCTYLFGFTVSYGIACLSKLWDRRDFWFNANALADFYNLLFFIAFLVNLVLGKIDFEHTESGDLQAQSISVSVVVLGIAFFVMMRRRKFPLNVLTWVLMSVVNFVVHMFNMFVLNQVVYQAY